jgi:two-component system chemotaxis response regulator CheB
MLEGSPLIDVVGFARDGEEALRIALKTPIDLITLDLEMPRMDGFTFLRLLMARKPTPVIVISGRAGDQDVFKALDLGAVDFVAKPTPRATPELATIEQELVRKVLASRQLRIEKVRDRALSTQPPASLDGTSPAADHRVVAIGSSTGGPASLMQLFGAFAEPPPYAFAISQHMPAGFTRGFADRLDRMTPLSAREAETGLVPEPGTILVAPGGRHLEFESRDGEVQARVVEADPDDRYAPAVDRMFATAAKSFGHDLLAIVLTGMGNDGAGGVRAVKEAGGSVIAESEETAVIFGMPGQAIRTGMVDQVLRLDEIAGAIQTGVVQQGASAPTSKGSS